jgi:SagB-type dehydrogenase family enzyme
MRVRVAESGLLFWDGGKLVWDDYIGQKQVALTADSERLLRWFSDWRELSSVRALGDEYLLVAERLVETGILIAEDSAAHHAEQRLLAHWGAWDPPARYFHFASRTLTGTPFHSKEAAVAHMEERARAHVQAEAVPERAKTYPERPLIAIPATRPDDGDWPRRSLLDSLYDRRSTRRFAREALTLDELGKILHIAGSFVATFDEPEARPAGLKTSPSAGALHSVELYVDATLVEGLSPGLYHFAPTRGGLEELARDVEGGRELDAVGRQPWLAEAPALILYTAVIERAQWRYRTSRAYRDILIGLGHLSQTVLLTACAMGLGAVFATAVCHEDLERLLGCDPMAEVLLGVAAVGRPDLADKGPITW